MIRPKYSFNHVREFGGCNWFAIWNSRKEQKRGDHKEHRDAGRAELVK